MTSKTATIPAYQRHFALVLALLWSDRGLSREEILSQIPGYQDSLAKGTSQASLERMFERDKKSLEEIGITVAVIEDLQSKEGQIEYRYQIPKSSFQFPEDIVFSPEEIMLLNLAGKVWQGESLAPEVNRALTKVRAMGIEAPNPVIGLAPRLIIHDLIYRDLQRAIEENLVISFLYHKPLSASAELRRVEPLALVTFKDHWLLYSYDRARDDFRSFLLSRITGSVTVTEERFEERIDNPQQQAITEWSRLWQSNIATVQVQANSVAEANLMRRGIAEGAENTISLHYLDLHTLADDLAGHGPEVLVIAPEQLREQVILRLAQVVTDHQEGDDETTQ